MWYVLVFKVECSALQGIAVLPWLAVIYLNFSLFHLSYNVCLLLQFAGYTSHSFNINKVSELMFSDQLLDCTVYSNAQ
jgi:hypothetical protein